MIISEIGGCSMVFFFCFNVCILGQSFYSDILRITYNLLDGIILF